MLPPFTAEPWLWQPVIPAWVLTRTEWEDSKCSSSDGEWVTLGAVTYQTVRFCGARLQLHCVTLTAMPSPSTFLWVFPPILISLGAAGGWTSLFCPFYTPLQL